MSMPLNLKTQEWLNAAQVLLEANRSPVIGQFMVVDSISQTSQVILGRKRRQDLPRAKRRRKFKQNQLSIPFAISTRRDLTPDQIYPVARRLIKDNALLLFRSTHQDIYEAWKSSSPLASSTINNIDENLVAAFDIVHSFARNKKPDPLDLRFAYIHLRRAIVAHDAASELGYTEAYHNAKRDSSISSSQLWGYARISKRWSMLAGPSPFQLFVYSKLAETIVCNTSIKAASLKALAEAVYCPDLMCIMLDFSEKYNVDISQQ